MWGMRQLRQNRQAGRKSGAHNRKRELAKEKSHGIRVQGVSWTTPHRGLMVAVRKPMVGRREQDTGQDIRSRADILEQR